MNNMLYVYFSFMNICVVYVSAVYTCICCACICGFRKIFNNEKGKLRIRKKSYRDPDKEGYACENRKVT